MVKRKDFFDRVIYGNVEKNFYGRNRKLLRSANSKSIRTMLICFTLIEVVLFIGSFFTSYLSSERNIYAAMGLMSIVLIIISDQILKRKPQFTKTIFSFISIFIFTYSIYIGTVKSVNEQAVAFYFVLVVLPALYIEKPINSAMTQVVAWAVFSVVTIKVKQENTYIMTADLVTSFCLLIAGIALTYYIRNLLLESIQSSVSFQKKSQTDILTGITNKSQTESLTKAYLDKMAEDEVAALLILDLDYFKRINDTMGHATGDQVLRQVGVCLRGIFRGNDIIGRIGGDEFIVVMRNIKDSVSIEAKAHFILDRIAHVLEYELPFQISCSIGITVVNGKEKKQYEELFSEADAALYASKERGRNQYTFY